SPPFFAKSKRCASRERERGSSYEHIERRLSIMSETGSSQEREPLAIIGMGCRFPGAESPQAFWEGLMNGFDAIGEIPPDRWDTHRYYHPDPTHPGTMYSRQGGFLSY